MEIAREFPFAEVVVSWLTRTESKRKLNQQGLDLAPMQRDHGIPDNCSFRIDDATKGIPFPDDYFDVIHTRFLIAGVFILLSFWCSFLLTSRSAIGQRF